MPPPPAPAPRPPVTFPPAKPAAAPSPAFLPQGDVHSGITPKGMPDSGPKVQPQREPQPAGIKAQPPANLPIKPEVKPALIKTTLDISKTLGVLPRVQAQPQRPSAPPLAPHTKGRKQTIAFTAGILVVALLAVGGFFAYQYLVSQKEVEPAVTAPPPPAPKPKETIALLTARRATLPDDFELKKPLVSWNATGISFSPSGERVVYKAKKDKKEFLVVNGNEEPRYDEIPSYLWSGDGEHLAYVGKEKSAAKGQNGTSTVVLDGTALGAYGSLQGIGTSTQLLAFTKKSELVYFVSRNGEKIKFVNGAETAAGEGPPEEDIKLPASATTSTLAFEGHTIFQIKKDGKYYLVIDGRETPKGYDLIWPPQLSREKTYAGFGALDGKDLWWVVHKIAP